jgi:hypothetical protein
LVVDLARGGSTGKRRRRRRREAKREEAAVRSARETREGVKKKIK